MGTRASEHVPQRSMRGRHYVETGSIPATPCQGPDPSRFAAGARKKKPRLGGVSNLRGSNNEGIFTIERSSPAILFGLARHQR